MCILTGARLWCRVCSIAASGSNSCSGRGHLHDQNRYAAFKKLPVTLNTNSCKQGLLQLPSKCCH